MNDLVAPPPSLLTASNISTSTKASQTTNAAIKSPTTAGPNTISTKATPKKATSTTKVFRKLNNANKTRAPRKVKRTPKTSTIRNVPAKM